MLYASLRTIEQLISMYQLEHYENLLNIKLHHITRDESNEYGIQNPNTLKQ